jgi:hypothetical protein
MLGEIEMKKVNNSDLSKFTVGWKSFEDLKEEKKLRFILKKLFFIYIVKMNTKQLAVSKKPFLHSRLFSTFIA